MGVIIRMCPVLALLMFTSGCLTSSPRPPDTSPPPAPPPLAPAAAPRGRAMGPGGLLQPGIAFEPGERVGKGQPVVIHHEAQAIAVRAAAEAVVESLVVVHREARRAFVVERAQPRKLATALHQLDRAPDQRRKHDARADGIGALAEGGGVSRHARATMCLSGEEASRRRARRRSAAARAG